MDKVFVMLKALRTYQVENKLYKSQEKMDLLKKEKYNVCVCVCVCVLCVCVYG